MATALKNPERITAKVAAERLLAKIASDLQGVLLMLEAPLNESSFMSQELGDLSSDDGGHVYTEVHKAIEYANRAVRIMKAYK